MDAIYYSLDHADSSPSMQLYLGFYRYMLLRATLAQPRREGRQASPVLRSTGCDLDEETVRSCDEKKLFG